MEVTRDNFREVYPIISSAINEADFVALDGEFSGLGVDLAKFQYDSLEDRYRKLREGIRGFLMIQVGLCPFKWIQEKQRYEAKPFNVYVFPRPLGRIGENTRFACQCGSLDFLALNGFDFNKLFHKGVSYLLPSDENKIRENIARKQAKIEADMKQDKILETEAKTNTTPVPLKFKEFVEKTCKGIQAFLDDEEKVHLDLEPASGFKRKLIYEAVESRFPTGIYLESCPSSKGKFLRVHRGNEKEKEAQKELKRSAEERELEVAIGFSKVMRDLQKSEKLIVGHNMLLDVMLSINQFFSPLPEDLAEFKVLVQTAYSKLVDTKLLASTTPLKEEIGSSVLMDLRERITQHPFVEPEIDMAETFDLYKDNSTKYHDAGYDSYITGLTFIAMARHLVNKLPSIENAGTPSRQINFDAPILKPFLNKINVTRLHDIPYLNTKGEDPKPNRNNVFCVQCPASWTTSSITSLFSPYGFVYVSWVNEKETLVALDKTDRVFDVIRNLVAGSAKGDYRVLTYAQFKGEEDINKYNNPDNLPTKKKKRKRRRQGESNCVEVDGTDIKVAKQIDKKEDSDPEEGEIRDSDSEKSENKFQGVGADVHEEMDAFDVPLEW